MVELLSVALILMRLMVFGLALGITLISFQAYSERGSEQLQYAFIGFAFISMGIGLTNLNTQLGAASENPTAGTTLQIVETVPFIIGFSMLYLSLYR